jgi:glycine cleavage system H lipoate-binding protein
MSKLNNSKRDLYYTNRHDWIDFQGSVAYIGATMLKVMQVSQEFKLKYVDNHGFARKGDIFAHFESDGSTVPVHMPVDGKIISLNDIFLEGNAQVLIDQPENKGWLALIAPTKPYERDGLLQPEQYRQFVRQNPL